ncbi:MAG: thiamine phosphate synthase [Bacteroidetes bacterium]|nr:thiamine phosphate synthase [Bacteroidota bacterium]
MRLIAFTYPGNHPKEAESLGEILSVVDALHIRKVPAITEQEMRNLLDGFPGEYLSGIWIHDHYHLAELYSLGGVHLTREYLESNRLTPEAGIQKWNLKGVKASVTCSSMETLEILDKWADRIFIAPVFDSISKEGHTSKWNLDFWSVPKGLNAEIIALGGVALDKLPLLIQKQFHGIAVLGALWQSNDPIELIKELKQACIAGTLTY